MKKEILKIFIDLGLVPEYAELKTKEILLIFGNYLKENDVNRTEIRHKTVQELIIEFYKNGN